MKRIVITAIMIVVFVSVTSKHSSHHAMRAIPQPVTTTTISQSTHLVKSPATTSSTQATKPHPKATTSTTAKPMSATTTPNMPPEPKSELERIPLCDPTTGVCDQDADYVTPVGQNQ